MRCGQQCTACMHSLQQAICCAHDAGMMLMTTKPDSDCTYDLLGQPKQRLQHSGSKVVPPSRGRAHIPACLLIPQCP
jgi:hypothetical protein